MPRRHIAAHVQVERHGVTIVFESVPIERIGDVLDRVLSQLGLLEKIHELEAPEPASVQVGGYHEVPVPDWRDDDAWDGEVIGFTRPTDRPLPPRSR